MSDKKIILSSPCHRSVQDVPQIAIDCNCCYLCPSKEKLSCPATYEKIPQGKSRTYLAAEEYQQIEQSILRIERIARQYQ